MPSLERFYHKSSTRRRERSRARDVESALFTSSSILSTPWVQTLYKKMSLALASNKTEQDINKPPKDKVVVLDGYPARDIIAAEYLLLKRRLFNAADRLHDRAESGLLLSDNQRRIYFKLNGAVIQTDYCPARGHLGNYTAYVYANGKWSYMSCDAFNTLISNIINRNDQNEKVGQAIFTLMTRWAETGDNVFKDCLTKRKPSNRKVFNVALNDSKENGVEFTLKNGEIKQLRFLFFFLLVKEVTRRMGVREYYNYHRNEKYAVGHPHYGKSLAFSYFIAMAVKLVKNGKLRADDICSLRSNYGVHSGRAVTRTATDDNQNLGRTKERAMRVTKCYHEFFGHHSDRLSRNHIKDAYRGVYLDGDDLENINLNELSIEREDAWSEDECDVQGVCKGKPKP